MLNKIINEDSIAQIGNLIKKNDKFLMVGHLSPDGDAVGASLALFHLLTNMGKSARVIVPNVFPNFLKWLPDAGSILQYDSNKTAIDGLIAQADVIFCLDFNALKRMGALGDAVGDALCHKIMIDHHLDPESFSDVTISMPKMSSTSELLYRVIYQLGLVKQVDKTVATCLYTGMMTDTGGFTYNSNRRDIYLIISDLIDIGIDKDDIYRRVNNNYSFSRLSLEGYVLYHKLKVYPQLNASLISLTRDELKNFDYVSGDSEGFVNIPLQILGMRLSCFLREDKDMIKISLRSVGNFPCNELAAAFFNGGGHKNASGGEFSGTMEQAIAQYEKALTVFKKQLIY